MHHHPFSNGEFVVCSEILFPGIIQFAYRIFNGNAFNAASPCIENFLWVFECSNGIIF